MISIPSMPGSGMIGRGRFDPSRLGSTLKLWVEPETENTGTLDATVASVADLSGNGNTFTQATEEKKLTLSTAGLGGMRSLYCTGTTKNLTLAHASSASLAALQNGSYSITFLIQQTDGLSRTWFSKGLGGPKRFFFRTNSGGVYHEWNAQEFKYPGAGEPTYVTRSTPVIITMTFARTGATSGTQTVWVDGHPISSRTSSSFPAIDTTSEWAIGPGGTSTYEGYIGHVSMCDTVLSSASILKLHKYLASKCGKTLRFYSDPDLLLLDGDSNSSSSTGWIVQMYPQLGKDMLVVHRGYPGASMTDISNMRVNASSVVGAFGYPISSGTKVAVLQAGTNDITAGTSAATIYANCLTWCTAMHAQGFKPVVFTVPPRSTNDATKETTRQSLNAMIAAGHADGTLKTASIIDLAADPTLGPFSATANTSLYSDGTHFTAQGVGSNAHGIIAGIALAAIEPLYP